MLSLLEHTRERQPDHSGWKVNRRGDTCISSKSNRGQRHIHRKYVECGKKYRSKGGIIRNISKTIEKVVPI